MVDVEHVLAYSVVYENIRDLFQKRKPPPKFDVVTGFRNIPWSQLHLKYLVQGVIN